MTTFRELATSEHPFKLVFPFAGLLASAHEIQRGQQDGDDNRICPADRACNVWLDGPIVSGSKEDFRQVRSDSEMATFEDLSVLNRPFVLRVSLLLFLSLCLSCPRLAAQSVAQSPTLQWEVDAGGKMAFDVASVKRDVSDQPAHSNVGLSDPDDLFRSFTLRF
jgi:hypothetical protein